MHIRHSVINLVCRLYVLFFFLTTIAALASTPHYVFAHYMVCYSEYGANLEGYKQEIQAAQAAGIDGFALDVGAWSGSDWYYKTNVELIYDAAQNMNSGFKLFFSVDMANTNDIVQMISSYAKRTNSFYYNGGLVVSTFGGNDMDWTNSIFQPLQTMGISNIFFVPDFQPSGVSAQTLKAGVSALITKYNYISGLFDFACGLPSDINNINASFQQACRGDGKLFIAGFSPSYWGCAQTTTGRSYFESQGGEGTILQWNWILQNQPDWVEIVTWNDLNESTYINPLAAPDQYYSSPPKRYTHAGYLELSKQYISWYKTGVAPAINQDSLFYFYRTHSTNAVASDIKDIQVTNLLGDVQDVIYNTLFLTAPAQLNVMSGTNSVTYSLSAGLQQVRTPFAPGTQTFTVTRNGFQVLSVQGPQILSSITNYDYFPASGFAYGLSAPTKLTAKP
jgi:glucan endo-1,3-alpha-glucosidase